MSELIATNLAKSYKSRQVVKSVSVTVKSSQVVGLLGPNGAGKTTTFYMIVGLVRCDEGSIFLDGQNITQLPLHVRAKRGIGYLPQEASVFRKLSVKDNIMAILQTRRELSKQQRNERLEQLMDELHISHVQDSLGMSLSGGERRRVEIARALCVEPKFILLDEPFAGVDPLSVADIQNIITHLSERNIGVLITDHNVKETLGICEQVYIINDGNVIKHGLPADVMQNEQVKEVYLGQNFRI